MMPRKFAQDTSVTVEKSEMEIRKLVLRYGAGQIMVAIEDNVRAAFKFSIVERQICFIINYPNSGDLRYAGNGRERTDVQVRNAVEKETRRLWRALFLYIKGTLEAVESGLIKIEEGFLANIVLPDGKRFSQFALPQIEQTYKSGQMPDLLEWNN